MTMNRPLFLLALTPVLLVTLLVVALFATAHQVQHDEKQQRLNAFINHKACLEACKVGLSPGISHVVIITANDESPLPVLNALEWQTVVKPLSVRGPGLARSDADWERLDPKQMDEVIRVSAPIPYNDLKSVFGLPVDVFYHPVRQELVTVFNDQVYSATRMTQACEVEPHILYDAPTTVYYVSSQYLLEQLRQSPRTIRLNADGYIRWVGELNIRIFCTLS